MAPFRLATKNDIREYIGEKSPHVEYLNIHEDKDGVHITIYLKFWYWLFFRKTFRKFIMAGMDDIKMLGIDYIVKIR